MPLQQTKKTSDLEKRLKLLRTQVHGKNEFKVQSSNFKVPGNNQSQTTATKSDIAYLYQDLTKIGILASLAIGGQIILFYLTSHHILNLKLF